MSPTQQISGELPSYRLPITLSHSARRQVLMHTGNEPDDVQAFEIERLTDIEDRDERLRFLELWDRLDVTLIDAGEFVEEGGVTICLRPPQYRNQGYDDLLLDDDHEWRLYSDTSIRDSVSVQAAFHATRGATVTALDKFRRDVADTEAAAAMLAGAPLIEELDAEPVLSFSVVLDAYERALALAALLTQRVRKGATWPREASSSANVCITTRAVMLNPGKGARPAAILKQSDLTAYKHACDLLRPLAECGEPAVRDAIAKTCRGWWSQAAANQSDAQKVDRVLQPNIAHAMAEMATARSSVEDAARYEFLRDIWIADHGSKRLRRAAERGYKHDGIYRDERVAQDFPGFVASLGRRAKVRDLVNPSEAALEMEAETLIRGEELGMPDELIRLVYAEPGDDTNWDPGEFVQVERYLGRHTLWRSVSGRARNYDDIPF